MLASRTVILLLGSALLAHAIPVDKVGHQPIIGNLAKELQTNPDSGYPPQEGSSILTFDNNIDHFDKSRGTYQQKYAISADYFKPGGPVFLILGYLESSGLEYVAMRSQTPWYEFAKEQGALLVGATHRFYKDNLPTSDMSTENLKVLTSEQAIEDYANLIKEVKSKFPMVKDSKWVTFGSAYSGNLAVWMREKHPELVDFAYASSAPVTAQFDFSQYMEGIKAQLEACSLSCASSIETSFQKVASLLKTEAGRATLQTTFGLCEKLDINNKLQIQNFWSTILIPYMNLDYQSGFFYKDYSYVDIKYSICAFHDDNSLTSLAKLQEVNEYFNSVNDPRYHPRLCTSIDFDSLIKPFKNTTRNRNSDNRARLYQTCNEFGFYITTDSSTVGSFWGGQGTLNTDFYAQQCAAVFGEQFSKDNILKAVEKTNKNYGATSIETTGIILSNGSLDPWFALGKQKSDNKGVVTVVIEGFAHCADIAGSSTSDPPTLAAAKKTIYDTLRTWLNGSTA